MSAWFILALCVLSGGVGLLVGFLVGSMMSVSVKLNEEKRWE
jgi:hypothetical protein